MSNNTQKILSFQEGIPYLEYYLTMILLELTGTEGFCSFLCPMLFNPCELDRWFKIIVSGDNKFSGAVLAV